MRKSPFRKPGPIKALDPEEIAVAEELKLAFVEWRNQQATDALRRLAFFRTLYFYCEAEAEGIIQ